MAIQDEGWVVVSGLGGDVTIERVLGMMQMDNTTGEVVLWT
jgi:hypothetical protein